MWLGLVQPGGRNVLSNDIVIRDTTQLWSNGDTLRINYIDKEGATKKIAFCPLRSSLNLEDAVDEDDFTDFVSDAEPATNAEPKTEATSSGGAIIEAPTSNTPASESVVNPLTTLGSDSTSSSTKSDNPLPSPQPDLLAGKQRPSFPLQVASLLQSHTAICKVKISA